METQFKNIADFKNQVSKDPELKQILTDDPIKTIQGIQQKPLDFDVWIYRIVVSSLGVSIISIVIGIIVITSQNPNLTDKNIPTILTAIGSGAIGALAGLLAPSPKNISTTN